MAEDRVVEFLGFVRFVGFHGNLSFFVEFARYYREGEVRSLQFSKELFLSKINLTLIAL